MACTNTIVSRQPRPLDRYFEFETTQYRRGTDVQKMIKVIYTVFLGNIGQAVRTNSRFGLSGSSNAFPGPAAARRCTTRWMLFIFASMYMRPTRHCQWIVELLKYYRRGAMTLTAVQECFRFWYAFVAVWSFYLPLLYTGCVQINLFFAWKYTASTKNTATFLLGAS